MAWSSFYLRSLSLPSAGRVENGQIERFMVGQQWVGYSQEENPKETSLTYPIAFTTTDIEARSVSREH